MGETMLPFIKIFSLTFLALFPVVNPIGGAPIFLSLTRNYSDPTQKLLARKIAVYGFVILAVSLLIGSKLLAFLGINLSTMQIAGGLIVASTGWNLLNQPDEPAAKETGPQPTLEDALRHAFYPLTLPITVGPGCISIAITIGAHVRRLPGTIRGYHGQFLGALAAMVAMCLLVAVCYGNADRLVRLLGASGTNILIRLSAFVLLCIGVQIMWNGLGASITTLMGH